MRRYHSLVLHPVLLPSIFEDTACVETTPACGPHAALVSLIRGGGAGVTSVSIAGLRWRSHRPRRCVATTIPVHFSGFCCCSRRGWRGGGGALVFQNGPDFSPCSHFSLSSDHAPFMRKFSLRPCMPYLSCLNEGMACGLHWVALSVS